MNTRVYTHISEQEIGEVGALLRAGGLAAIPTETVYGLAANALDADAVRRIFAAKGRPQDNPLILHVYCRAQAESLVEFNDAALYLARVFWPGPLTIILPAKDNIPSITLAGGNTVGLRCPDHPLTLSLLRLARIPLAGPSANPSGKPSPKTAEEVLAYFDGAIGAVVDGGKCGLGKESTILDMSALPWRIVRHGALSEEIIADALMDSMTVYGLTGGSGSGKTTVLEYLTNRGALGLDCDAIYHE